jgi:hypothetical protein
MLRAPIDVVDSMESGLGKVAEQAARRRFRSHKVSRGYSRRPVGERNDVSGERTAVADRQSAAR